MDGVTLITGPRTGAGHLMALLRNFEAVAPCDGLFADGYQDAGGKLELAELEARSERKSLIVLKATSAISREVMEREILSRPGMRAILLVRRQIDAYVSLAKASALDAWRETDLTPVKVKLDPQRFANWLDEQEQWYAHWTGWLAKRGLPAPVLRYETHLNVPADAVLRRFSLTAAQLGITLKLPTSLAFEGLKQQDRNKAVALKVRNWPEFSKALIEMGIEKRAFGYPL